MATPCSVTETGLVLLVDLVVEVGDELLLRRGSSPRASRPAPSAGEAGELDVQVGRLLGGAGDDQRRAGLVDEDVVDLVHDREGVAALDLLAELRGHVVAQVVEAELGVGAVDDVAGVRLLLLLVGLLVLQDPDGDARARS